MTIAKPQNVSMSSDFTIDQIIGSFSGTLLVPAGSFAIPVTATVTINTGIPDFTFYRGNASIDGFSTFNDINGEVATGTNIVDYIYYLETFVNGAEFRVKNFTTNPLTVQYRFVSIARPFSTVELAPTGASKLSYSSKYNYQKVYKDVILPISVGAGGATTVSYDHNLGYVPKVSFFFYNNATGRMRDLIYQNNSQSATIDTNNFTFLYDNATLPATTGDIYLRIYYDA